MTTLREEIEEYLGSCSCIWKIKPVYVSDIIKLIEKRIDEKIEWANSTPKNKLDKAIKNKEIDEIFFRGFHKGFEEALIQLKQELLD